LPLEDLVTITPGEVSARDAYRLLVSVVVPRPIAWVSSISSQGQVNLAPFSFFNLVGDDPPTVMVSIGQKRGGVEKDTLHNILDTGEYVVHIAGRDLAEQLNLTSGEWAPDVDEFQLAGLTPVASLSVRAPRVEAAPVAIEVRLSQVVRVEGTGYTMVLGRVLQVHVRRDLLRDDGLVDAARLRALARLGGDDYTSVESTFSMVRPRV
jgi:flavin reductase (DIM6/NTAB) family NADH-FMN oxidoreductase RutF